MKLYSDFEERDVSLPSDPARQAEIERQHAGLPERTEIEVMAELMYLKTDDFPGDSRAFHLSDASWGAGFSRNPIEVFQHPVGPRGQLRMIVSVDRDHDNRACYHGTLTVAVPKSQIGALVASDLGIVNPVIEVVR